VRAALHGCERCGRDCLPLEIHEIDGFLSNVLGADFQFLDQFSGRARVAKTVFDADGCGDDRVAVEQPATSENGRDAAGQGADLMLLRSDDDACFAGGADNGLGIDGLEGVQIEHAGLVAVVQLEDAGGAHTGKICGGKIISCIKIYREL